MVYRIVKYTGETMKALLKRIKEIEERDETLINFEIQVYE